MDPVADMLVAIKNGYLARKDLVTVPYSKFKHEIVKVLEKKKLVGILKKEDNKLLIELVYENSQPKIKEIKRVSKLGLRTYSKYKHINLVRGGRGFYIISTPKGVMESDEATKLKVGGELICMVY